MTPNNFSVGWEQVVLWASINRTNYLCAHISFPHLVSVSFYERIRVG